MFNLRFLALALAGAAVVRSSTAVTLQEDFASDPAARGWRAFGQTNLFSWNAAGQNLHVTWDSSQTNSYFYLPLDVTLTRADDFTLAFDLRLADVAAGINPAKPWTFQLAAGLLNFTNATDPAFFRGSGVDAVHGPRNLVEFAYFPTDGVLASTVAPTMISADNQFAPGGFSYPRDLATNTTYHIRMSYAAMTGTLTTTVTTNGVPIEPIANVVLNSTFTDFRVDTLAIASYSDAGQDPQWGGSLLAHGVIDNVILDLPPTITGGFSNQVWTARISTRTNWFYTLERTTDFLSWTPASPTNAGNGAILILQDPAAPPARAFYRVRAQQP